MARQLAVQERDASKKSMTRKLRKSGRIPAVLYGKTANNQSVSVDERDMVRIFNEEGKNGLISLDLNGKTFSVMTHDVQYDHLKREFIHLDFLEVDMSSEIDVEVPIHFIGEAIGVKQGGIVQHHLNALTMRLKPTDIPSSIDVDVAVLDVGDVVKVKDVKEGSSYEILNDDDDVIISIVPPARDAGEEKPEDKESEEEPSEESKE